MLTHPLATIPVDKRSRVFVPWLIATLLMTFLFRFIGPAKPSIVDYELAGSVSKATEIINAWNENDRIRAGFSLGIDYLYMPVYSTTIALACVWGAGVLKNKSWRTIGILLAWGLWAAAVFDAIENLGLVVSLFGSPVAPWPLVSQVCATLKFTLIIVGLLYVVVGVILRVVSQPNPHPASP
jgi:hypothetical protein